MGRIDVLRSLSPAMASTTAKTTEASPRRPSKSRQAARTRKLLGILSRKRSLYSTARLVEATKERGHQAASSSTRCAATWCSRTRPRMIYRGGEVRGPDVVIPRIGASITGYGLAVVSHLEHDGRAGAATPRRHRAQPRQAALPAAARAQRASTSRAR